MLLDTLLESVESYLESDIRGASGKLHAAERDTLLQHVLEARQLVAIEGVTNATLGQIEDADAVFRRIMVAVDSSEQSGFAVAVAGRLAKRLGCELSLIHVVHLPMLPTAEVPYERIELHPTLMENAQKLLDRTARRLGNAAHVETILREGDPATEIADTANRLGADLVVIGTHGRGRFSAAVVGSVAQGVMRRAVCPVVCVAHDPKELAHSEKTSTDNCKDYFPALNV